MPNYDLTVLRGRLGTLARTWDDANTEIWIIPRAALTAFEHADLLALRQNKAAGTTPTTGYFRLTTRTFSEELELADAVSIPYAVPTKRNAAPEIELITPASPPTATTTYPYDEHVTGTLADSDADLTGWQVLKRKAGGVDSIAGEAYFSPQKSAAFDVHVAIDEPATWTVTIRAFDYLGNVTDRTFTIAATGSGSKVDAPLFYWNGLRLPPTTQLLGVGGPLELRCGTIGALIKWRLRYHDFATSTWGPWQPTSGFNDYDYLTPPFTFPGTPWIGLPNYTNNAIGIDKSELEFYATKAGLTDSAHTTLTIL